jgi:surface polysaccharide O-acyltransferase-like enzyme
MENKKTHIIYLDIIRSIAIIFVIMLHSSDDIGAVQNGTYWVSYAYRGILDCAVPLFVMISGALLLGKVSPIRDFVKRRFSRILLPFIFWSIVLYLIYGFLDEINLYPIHQYTGRFFNFLMENKIHGVYWYIYMLVGLYLIAPLLQRAFSVANKNGCIVLYCIVLWIAFQLIKFYYPLFEIVSRYTCSADIYIGYFIMGHYIFEYGNQIKYGRIIAIIGIVFFYSLAFLALPGLIRIPTDLFLSICLFLFFSTIKEVKNKTVLLIVGTVSRYSYAIYLTHVLFISAFVKIGLFRFVPVEISPLIMMSCVLLCDLFFLMTLNKIPFLRKYIGT